MHFFCIKRWSIFARLGTSEVTVGLNAYIHRMARNVKKYVIVVKIYATSQLDVRVCFCKLLLSLCIQKNNKKTSKNECFPLLRTMAKFDLSELQKKRRRVLLDILDTCVKRSVFILIMARSVKVTTIVVKTCVTSPMDANLLRKVWDSLINVVI